MRTKLSGRVCQTHKAFTLIELLITIAILLIVASIAMSSYSSSKLNAQVVVAKSNLRLLKIGAESFYIDHSSYPSPSISPASDPYGVVAEMAAYSLTTPISYISPSAFIDPFGDLKIQSSVAGRSPIGMPIETFNPMRSLLYFHYPHISGLVNAPELSKEGYAFASLGPDHLDSFILYLPFPGSLPPKAATYGIYSLGDTIYDPTNGVTSQGDIAGFGGEIPMGGIVGGAQR